MSKIIPDSKKCIAVLLATYNGEEWLSDLLRSILTQRDVMVNIFVSDDLSTDQTWTLLKSYRDERISLLPRGQKFGSAAQNFFRLIRDVNFEQYDYVAFADQDDVWNADKLSISVAKIMEQGVDAFSSNVIAYWANGKKKLIRKSQPQQKFDHIFESAGPGCTYVLSRHLAVEFSSFLKAHQSETTGIALHDWLIYAWARCNGYRWWINPQPTLLYRQHSTNEFGANQGIKAILDRWRKLCGGWYRTQVLTIAFLCRSCEVWPVKRMQKYHLIDRIVLVFHINQIRRRKHECFALAVALLMPSRAKR